MNTSCLKSGVHIARPPRLPRGHAVDGANVFLCTGRAIFAAIRFVFDDIDTTAFESRDRVTRSPFTPTPNCHYVVERLPGDRIRIKRRRRKTERSTTKRATTPTPTPQPRTYCNLHKVPVRPHRVSHPRPERLPECKVSHESFPPTNGKFPKACPACTRNPPVGMIC